MHIPDQVLRPEVLVGTGAISAIAVGWSAWRVSARQPAEVTPAPPLLGVLGAFVFAAQMVNFPVGVAVSAHLLGSAFLTILLGPSAAILAISAVLLIQAFIFTDGGFLALGANILNMGVVASLTAYLVYRLLQRGPRRGWRFHFVVAVASFTSVMAAAGTCVLELIPSFPKLEVFMSTSILAMHVFFGVGEALITVMSLEAVRVLAPELFRAPPREAEA